MKTIYSISKTGKITTWSADLNLTPNSDGYLEIAIESGYEDGKKINKTRLVKSGKNLGRANETSLEAQAKLELERLYQDKYDKGYKDNKDDVSISKKVDDISKPMLADKYPEKVHKLPLGLKSIALQPKVDGLRCFIEKMPDESIRFSSRSGKIFTPIPFLTTWARSALKVGDIFDGELYIPGKPLQEIMSIVSPTKNIKTELLKTVQFFWYDYIPKGQEDKSFKERFIDSTIIARHGAYKLETILFEEDSLDLPSGITVEGTQSEYLIDIFDPIFDSFIEEGYEGMMIRDITSPYYFGRRSVSLLKYKKMQTEEFQIVDILESDNDEAPRFVCDLRNGNEVTVRLKGDKEENLKYLNNKETYIGKWLTIKYQIKTVTGSLQFPVGVAIRDGEVIDGEFVPSI